nr:unnamed protein product [Digitaria exilis]
MDRPGPRHRSLINGQNLIDVVITGNNGTIDGQGPIWWNWLRSNTNVVVHNTTIQTSLDAPLNHGIVPDSCSHMHIEDSSISVSHDAISLKSGWDKYGITFGRPTSEIHIRRVDLQSPLGAGLAFGSEMSGGISDVHADHLRIHALVQFSPKFFQARHIVKESFAVPTISLAQNTFFIAFLMSKPGG